MFAARVNFASIRASRAAVRCLPSVNNRQGYSKQLSATNSQPEPSRVFLARWTRAYTTEVPSKADAFGELGNRQFEKVEMDEDEKAEEKFVENEARVARRYRLTPGGYANLIKSHIQKRDLNAALEVLETVKENRDKPTVYMYNLLLRAFAVNGNFKKCRSLYATMKKRGLTCNAATYTSILNACANYHHGPTALEYLQDLRAELLENNVVLNETHYNAMIKAYGRHNELLEAFKIADEMRDKRLPTGEVTFNSLLYGAISDRESGLRHALAIWHVMLRHRIKPTLTTYNLMLRAIRDTKLGELKALDMVVSSSPETRILVDERARPDLLSRPPVVSSLAIKLIGESSIDEEAIGENEPEGAARETRAIGENQPEVVARGTRAILENQPEVVDRETRAIDENQPEVIARGSKAIDESRPEVAAKEPEAIREFESDIAAEESEATREFKSEIAVKESGDLPATVANVSAEMTLTVEQKRLIEIPLEKIHRKNRLMLFGGVNGFLERMAKDDVTPDTKSITLLMELVPRTTAAENSIVKLARSKGIPLDIDFFNMLMKKKSMRKDYAGAKEVLDDIQRCGLCPDVVTWGILAMGCENSLEARVLIEGMTMTGHRLNAVIAGTLISTACRKIRFGFILEIMETMVRMNVKPNWELYTILDNFQKEMEQMIKSKKFSRTVNHPAFKAGFSKFNQRYVSWQEQMERKSEKKPKKERNT